MSSCLSRAVRRLSRPTTPPSAVSWRNPLWQRLAPSFFLPRNNMEVTREDFERDDSQLLKGVVQAIRAAQFVAVDLEFSGVQRNPKSLGRQPTISDRYQLLKEGAEKYQVLQLGICPVHYDEQQRTYMCRPYTFPLCPVTDPKWHMEREYTYQSSAIKFLSENQFDFNLLFGHGIPYLSHEEEKYVRGKEKDAIEGVKEDIHIEDSQKGFLNEVVAELQEWIDDPEPEFDFVNITGPNSEINGYQKRLVHQVVRSKFPNLVTLSRNNFIQVIKRDDEQEAVHLMERKERSEKNIKMGIGLRYVVDALRECRVPLVGHNLIGDLVHIYRTFVGKLPDTVEEFAATVHADFPVVCDTKYISTCEGTVLGAASSLQTLNKTFSALQDPQIRLHMDHHTGLSVNHNAGYDSFITAKVFLRLIHNYQCRLERAGTGAAAERKARQELAAFVSNMGRTNPEIFDSQPLLPPFTSDIWNGLKNRLRVNGTKENVVVLDSVDEDGGVTIEEIQ